MIKHRYTLRASRPGLIRTGLLAATIAAPLPWLQAQNASPTVTVTTRLVVLDVVVVDGKGNPVLGLDRSQFTIFEDKTEQRLRSFEAPEDHPLPPAGQDLVHSTADLAKIGNSPVNVIVIDELNTAFIDSARARQAIQRFLEQQPAVLPVPTLFLAVGNSKVTVLHDFTQSRTDLLASLKKHFPDVDFQALTNSLNGGTMAAQEGFGKTLSALASVASSLRGIRGHKNVIWLGAGFDKAYDLTSSSSDQADKIEAALALVTRRMLEARISLSTIDPLGVDAGGGDEDIADEAALGVGPTSLDAVNNASFDDLAESTGGTAVHNNNGLTHLLANDAAHASDFYTLSYTPTSTSDADGKYRNIRVVMKNPNLRAITRTGYFGGETPEPPVIPQKPKSFTQEFKFDLGSAANSRMVYTGLKVTATKAGDGYDVMVNAGDLHWASGTDNQTAEVSIVGVAFNAKDKQLAEAAREFKQPLPLSVQPAGKRVDYHFRFETPANTTRMRFVVRDAATGDIGSYELTP